MGLDSSIVFNGEKFQSHVLTLALIGQSPMSSEIFSYATIYSNLKLLQIDRQTAGHQDRQTHADKFSIVAVDKPQL